MKPKREPMNASRRTVDAVMELTRDMYPADPGQAGVVATYILGLVEGEVGAALKKQNAMWRDALRQHREAAERAVTEAYHRGRQELLAGLPAAN